MDQYNVPFKLKRVSFNSSLRLIEAGFMAALTDCSVKSLHTALDYVFRRKPSVKPISYFWISFYVDCFENTSSTRYQAPLSQRMQQALRSKVSNSNT